MKNEVYDRHGRSFKVGQLVESVFDAGTVYRITRLHSPSHAYEYSTYLTLDLVTPGSVENFNIPGRMADGQSYAPYHFRPVCEVSPHSLLDEGN
jgi:hypothetical protein